MSSIESNIFRRVSFILAVLACLAVPALAQRPRALVAEPVFLEFSGPLTDRRAEVSGLTWKDDWLVILPEDPTRFGQDGSLRFFLLSRAQILAAVDGGLDRPLLPRMMDCQAPGLKKIIGGFDGLEAVALAGDRVYLAVEAKQLLKMSGFLVGGRFDVTEDQVNFDTTRLAAIPLAGNIFNIAEETLITDGHRVITIGEANGRNLTDQPLAKVFDDSLNFLGAIPLPQIEYRVTDATTLDDQRRFWVINYFYPPDRLILKPAPDPELEKFGSPEGYDPGGCVERLLELELTPDDRIVRTETPPIYLARTPDQDCRNWEGLARLDGRGFLMMTDKYPGTLLAFVPNPYTARKEP